MFKKTSLIALFSAVLSFSSFSQLTHAVTDPEKKYKDVKEMMANEQYALAYPLLKDLKQAYPDNTSSDHAYLNEDISYYYIVCELKLMQETGATDALQYIQAVNNEPRKQILSFHLAHYYFLKDDFSNAVDYFAKAGYDNLDNEQIADAKFENAYAVLNLKQFAAAKPLFDEIHQYFLRCTIKPG